jgi:hypothetical protein
MAIGKFGAHIADAAMFTVLDAEVENRHGIMTKAARPPRAQKGRRENGRSGFLAWLKINSGHLRA